MPTWQSPVPAANESRETKRKYDDIVKYLQSAITAAAKEEDEFKRMAFELQDMLRSLMATKADKIELSQALEKLSQNGSLPDQLENIKEYLLLHTY